MNRGVRQQRTALGAALLFGAASLSCAQGEQRAALEYVDALHVAPPTGEAETDRANVQAAFDAVQPGGTILFAPGTYLLGAGTQLTVPDVTVLGHVDGTVLRGCDPEAFEVEAARIEPIVFGCTGLYVQTERQTIRGLTFEYIWHAITVGPYPTTAEEAAASGGPLPPQTRPEGSASRAIRSGPPSTASACWASARSARSLATTSLYDVFHAIGIYGAPLDFVDNRVTVDDPEPVPFTRHPGSAVIIAAGHTDCTGHVIAGNRIEGYPDAIYVLAGRGETCRGVEIRDNTIRVARVRLPEGGWYTPTDGDSTMVGAPITLMNTRESLVARPGADADGILEHILVQGNGVIGAEGLGILIQNASQSRIADNTITGIERRNPFAGIEWDGFAPMWAGANGSGIWISPGSDGNEITGNTFDDVASFAVFIEGDK